MPRRARSVPVGNAACEGPAIETECARGRRPRRHDRPQIRTVERPLSLQRRMTCEAQERMKESQKQLRPRGYPGAPAAQFRTRCRERRRGRAPNSPARPHALVGAPLRRESMRALSKRVTPCAGRHLRLWTIGKFTHETWPRLSAARLDQILRRQHRERTETKRRHATDLVCGKDAQRRSVRRELQG